jgi:cytochrome c biogenesis protein CcmG/thiol:disulfide interchange protein DsbE
VLAAFFYRGLSLNPGYIPSPMVGKPAPAFSLPSVKDPAQLISTTDMQGQLALLNVWGTWCVECRYEHDFLLELSRTGGIPIYGFNLKDDRAAAIEWLANLGNPYVASAADEEGYVAIDWGIYGAPETFLLDRDGTILHKHISPLTAAIWERDFMPIVREKCATLPCPLGSGEE